MALTCSSASCLSETAAGAPVSAHCACAVLGNAMTSRMLGAPASSMASRSRPKAMPPCGGAPYSKQSNKYPNLFCASSGLSPMISNTCGDASTIIIDATFSIHVTYLEKVYRNNPIENVPELINFNELSCNQREHRATGISSTRQTRLARRPHLLLHVSPVDAQAAAADFHSVVHQVVGLRARVAQVA